METLDLLEWPRVCRAVASFAATSLAKEQLQVLEIPATRDASEALLELTSAGVELISLLGGPFELGALRTQVVCELLGHNLQSYCCLMYENTISANIQDHDFE